MKELVVHWMGGTIIDTALKLRLTAEHESVQREQALTLLEKSTLVEKLTTPVQLNLLGKIFRLVGLAEIPFAAELPYTRELIASINKEIATPEGFSYLRNVEGIVPCYNAMLLEAYARLGLVNSIEAQNALNWIKKYQVFERNQVTNWPHGGICKHGGCMKATPCYIGIGKTIRALITYQEFSGQSDSEVDAFIQAGLDYMLKHQMFKRLSKDVPISPHITDIMFPQNYALSLTDLIYIVGKTKTASRAPEMMALLDKKKTKNEAWKIDYIYKYQGYVPFETRRKESEWVTQLFHLWLAD